MEVVKRASQTQKFRRKRSYSRHSPHIPSLFDCCSLAENVDRSRIHKVTIKSHKKSLTQILFRVAPEEMRKVSAERRVEQTMAQL